MQNEAHELLTQLRSRVQEERTALCEFIGKTPNYKELLKPASLMLDNVEQRYLDATILQEPRTEAALLNWLREAEKELRKAIARRVYVAGLLTKYGPDSQIIEGA
jgi:hypothetical protein